MRPGKHRWNQDTKTCLEAAWERKHSLPVLIDQYRQRLSRRSDDLSTRYLLANCLYAAGQTAQAEGEWDRVTAANVEEWTALVTEARASLKATPD